MYRIYEQTERKTGKRKVIVVSTYAGKEIKGIATCNPNDEYDYNKGCDLAMQRCNLKVAHKRKKNAVKKYEEACEKLMAAQKRVEKMKDYLNDASAAEHETYMKLEKYLKDC